MSFAGKAVLFWLAYAVIFSVVIALAVGQAKTSKPVEIYQELNQ